MRTWTTLAACSAAALLVGLAAPQPGAPKVGDSTSYTFRRPVFNGGPVKSLEDLRGKPVLIDFWGTR